MYWLLNIDSIPEVLGIFKSLWSWGTCGRLVWCPSCRRTGVPRRRMWGRDGRLIWQLQNYLLPIRKIPFTMMFCIDIHGQKGITHRVGVCPNPLKAACELRNRQDRTDFVMNLSLQWQVADGMFFILSRYYEKVGLPSAVPLFHHHQQHHHYHYYNRKTKWSCSAYPRTEPHSMAEFQFLVSFRAIRKNGWIDIGLMWWTWGPP